MNPDKPVPFDPGHSWALGGDRTAATRSGSVALACAVAAAYSAAGLMVAIKATNSAAVAGIAAVLGLVLKGLWFHPWLTFGVALDIAIAVAAVLGWPASLQGGTPCSPPNRSPASSPSPASPSWEPLTRRATSAAPIYRALKAHGHEVVAVNPNAAQVDGDPSYPDLASVPGALGGVLVMVKAADAVGIVRECLAMQVDHIWLFKGIGGPGACVG